MLLAYSHTKSECGLDSVLPWLKYRTFSRGLFFYWRTLYVRPLLEHISVIWSPLLKQDITAIEQVQRRFTKRLQDLRDLLYTERLRLLNLQSLRFEDCTLA